MWRLNPKFIILFKLLFHWEQFHLIADCGNILEAYMNFKSNFQLCRKWSGTALVLLNTSLCDRSRKLAPFCSSNRIPNKNQTRINHTRFPALQEVWLFFEFSLVLWGIFEVSGSVSIPHSCNQLEISFQKALECSQKTKRCSRVSSFLSQNEHKGDSTSLSLNSLELVNNILFKI